MRDPGTWPKLSLIRHTWVAHGGKTLQSTGVALSTVWIIWWGHNPGYAMSHKGTTCGLLSLIGDPPTLWLVWTKRGLGSGQLCGMIWIIWTAPSPKSARADQRILQNLESLRTTKLSNQKKACLPKKEEIIAAELNNSEIKLNSASRPFQALKLK